MTAVLRAQVCPTCGYGFVEPVPVGLCPICRFYGVASYLVEVEDRALVMALALERAIDEPLPRQPRRRRARSRRGRANQESGMSATEMTLSRVAAPANARGAAG